MKNKFVWSAQILAAALLIVFLVKAGPQERQTQAQERHTGAGETRLVARANPQQASEALDLTVGKSVLLDSMLPMERVSVGLGGFAEVTAVGPSEVLVNGKAPGETTLIIWQEDGSKLYYDVSVHPSRFLGNSRLELAGRQIREELPGQDIGLSLQDDTLFLRGKVRDLTSAERAFSSPPLPGKP